MAAAYSHELPRYGLEVGLTNYAAGTHYSNSIWKNISVYNYIYYN